MRNHTKVYMSFFGYGEESFVPCEVCGARAVDIHHIDARGMGGSGDKDVIENLMGVCRKCHIEYGDRKHLKDYLRDIHQKFMEEFKNKHL